MRPPQPSVYFFVIDVTYPTIESGKFYSVEHITSSPSLSLSLPPSPSFSLGLLGLFCRTLLDCLTKLPGDGRTMVGFLTFDHNLHFYNLKVYLYLTNSIILYFL